MKTKGKRTFECLTNVRFFYWKTGFGYKVTFFPAFIIIFSEKLFDFLRFCIELFSKSLKAILRTD